MKEDIRNDMKQQCQKSFKMNLAEENIITFDGDQFNKAEANNKWIREQKQCFDS